ncbi:MAG: C25 family cysteine peptidase [bacterium]
MALPFQALIDHKKAKGLTSTIKTTQWIYENYTGRDNQERIRNFIIDYYKNYGTEYVLLGGDVELVPYRSASYNELTQNTPCDLYYACLDGSWDKNNNNIFGELEDGVDLMPEVYVGRAPVNTQEETKNFVNKVITYTNNKNAGYLLNELLIGWKADEQSDCAEVKEEIATYTATFYKIYKEYESKEGVSLTRIIDYINQGMGLINHAGHANSRVVPPFEISTVDNLTNKDKPFIFYTLGCLPGSFERSDCIGEHFVTNPEGGAVAFIGNSRYGWYRRGNTKAYSGEYDMELFRQYFKEYQGHPGKGPCLL